MPKISSVRVNMPIDTSHPNSGFRAVIRLACLLPILVMSACTTRVANDDQPDIDDIAFSPMSAFDIRLFMQTHGKPQYIDLEAGALVYWNRYYSYSSENIFFKGEPRSSSIKYLVLTHTDQDYHYTGEVFSEYRAAVRRSSTFSKEDKVEYDFVHIPLRKQVKDIRRYCHPVTNTSK